MAQHYRDGIIYTGRFPSDENSPSVKKTDNFGLAYAWAIWSSAQEGSFSYSFANDYDKVIRNRKFARGQHSVDEYKPRAIASEREFVTVDYSINTPLPKMLRVTKENVLGHAYKPKVKPYDSHVHTKYEQEKNKVLGEMVIANEMRKLAAQGVVPDSVMMDERIAKAPKDPQEAEAYLNTTFQVLEAIAIEKLIKHGFSKNAMERKGRKLVTDLVENKFAALYCGIDEDYNSKIEYIDLLNLVTSYCENDDFSDLTHVGHIKFVTVGEFRKLMEGRLSEQQIFEVVKLNIGKRVNDSSDFRFGNKRYFQDLSDADKRAMEGVMVETMCFEILTSDKTTYKEKQLETNGYAVSKKSAEYKGTSPKVVAHSGVVEKIYAGQWAVDTDYMISWGTKPNVIRKIRNGKYETKPCFSYIIRKPDMLEMSNVSMCEEAIPHVEQMIIYMIRMQHEVAISNPSGYSYDTSALAAALPGMGIDNLSPIDVAEITRQTGNTYYSSLREDGSQNLNPTPVKQNPSSLANGGLLILAELYNVELAKVKEILGINDAVDSSQPDKRTGLGVQQISIQAHKNSIKAIQEAYLDMIDEAAEIIAYGQQMAIQAGKETDEIKELLSDPELKSIQMKEVGEMMFNTEIQMLPTFEQKQSIVDKIGFAVQQGTLDIEDAIMLERMIMVEDNIDKAEILLGQKIADKRKRLQEEAMQASQLAQQEAQAKAQAEMQKEQASAQAKAQQIQLEKELELRNEIAKEEEKRKTEMVVIDGKKELLRLQAELDAMLAKKEEKNVIGKDSPNRTAPSEPQTDVTV